MRIGVFICHCGSNIGGTVDCAKVAGAYPDVVYAVDLMYSCAEPGQAAIEAAIHEHKLDGVVVASCSPRMHEPTFRRTVERAGLNRYMFEMANIREHVSWIGKDKVANTNKAAELVEMAVAKLRNDKPLFSKSFDINKRVLIIGGGVAGYTIMISMQQGVARGLFSNEAGMGSTPHAHAMAKVEKPQDQGVVAMVCVFIDTFVVLTITALVMITSGALNVGDMAANPAAENMAQVAFSTVFGSFGNFYVAICLLFFAFSTIIGWYFFGEQNVKYLFGVKAVKVYACIAVVCVALGAVLEAPLVWNLSDLFNALMVFPNLLALLALSGLVAKAARGGDALRK